VRVLQPLILAAMAATSPSCGPVDLETALALASENGDEVAIRRSELAAAEADLALARAARWFPIASSTLLVGPVPEARGTVTQPIAGSNRSLSGLGPFGRIDLNVVQPLFTWGRLDAAQAAARAGIEARTLLLQDTTSQIQLRVRGPRPPSPRHRRRRGEGAR
jgi:outer membrane protein TolC